MTFSYAGTMATDLDYIRLHIGDTTASSGPKPGTGTATNFTDEEINGLKTLQGTKERTVAALFGVLAAMWANYVDSKIGPRDEKQSQKAANFLALNKKWETAYGTATATANFSFVTRVDGYSDDITNDEVDETQFFTYSGDA
jgi:predicted outer membrane lipoprotein